MATSNSNIYMFGEATVNVPSFIPGIGGWNLGSGKVYFEYTNDNNYSNDFIAAWANINIPLYGETSVGFKVSLDGSYDVIWYDEVKELTEYAQNTIETQHEILEEEDKPKNKIGGDLPDSPANSATKLDGTSGNDILHGDNNDNEISGLEGDDWLFGEGGNDYLDGSDGNDLLDGDAGHDYLDGGAGDDYLDGDAGNDHLDGWDGNDYLDGDAGDDYLFGDAGDDYLFGDAGDDYLEGWDGNDSLSGGLGSDYLFGDAGDDTFKVNDFDGEDRFDGGSGIDTIIFSPSDNRNLTINIPDGGVGDGRTGGQQFKNIEVFIAGNGNDTLIGGSGNETLIGGAGSDSLNGGAGSDTFAFFNTTPNNIVDTITDFSREEGDKIQIGSGFGANSTDLFSYDSVNGKLSFDGNHFATLNTDSGFVRNEDIIFA